MGTLKTRKASYLPVRYRALVPGGERHNALETLRMLLASRPLVYIGFGLRDPDFLYVRDLLANTYKGGIRDHYAIMADVTEPEVNYWRRNYGIHLITYPTVLRPDNSRDHKALLELLDRLSRITLPLPVTVSPPLMEADQARTVLALARHAARLSRIDNVDLRIPLLVRIEKGPHVRPTTPNYVFSRYRRGRVERLLDNGPDRLVLIGHPGAGKSFSVRHSAARLAEKLHNRCLAERFDPNDVVVPIVVNLKLYDGDLWTLVEKTLPSDLSLANVLSRCHVKVYLDAFNEMPREYVEKGAWEADFSRFFKSASQAAIIITSRTIDELRNLDFPVFCIDSVNKEFVKGQIEKCGLRTIGLFQEEVVSILQRPFFFHLVSCGSLALSQATKPSDIFNTFLARLTSDFQHRFGIAFDVMRPLAALAQDAINRGEEAIPVAMAVRVMQDQLAASEIDGPSPTDIVNWLVGKDFLLPFSGGRIAFFHQSITEYLAATELARNYTEAPYLLRERLTLRRWDQSIFLTLNLLPREQATRFVETIMEMDFPLALSAVKFMESGAEEVVERLLSEVPKRVGVDFLSNFAIARALGSPVPVSLRHEPQLRNIMGLGNSVGGGAASCILSLRGREVKAEILQLLVENCDDYNFCAQIAGDLGMLILDTDVPELVTLADRVQTRYKNKEIKGWEGFDSALGHILSGLSPIAVRDAFYDRRKPLEEQEVRLSVLCDFLQFKKSHKALVVSCELLLAGVIKAIFCAHMILRSSKGRSNLDMSLFGEEHVKCLIMLSSEEEYGGWAIDVLRQICTARPDLICFVHDSCAKTSGVLHAALLSTIALNEKRAVFDVLSKLCDFSQQQLSKEPLELLSHLDLNWTGQEDLFVSLLRTRHTKLAWKLLEPTFQHNDTLGVIEIGPIQWWLEWIRDRADTKDGYWLLSRLSSLFARKLNDETRYAFISELNNEHSPYPSLLAQRILLARTDLSTDDLNEEAISFLFADLSTRKDLHDFEGHLLGITATEAFATERLLPLIPQCRRTCS